MPIFTDANPEVQPLSENPTAPEPRANARSREEFATAINALHRNSVEAIHEIGRMILEARIELTSADYQSLLQERLDFGPRNARLYMTVVRNPILVKRQYISQQPNSLTTLVALTKLPHPYLEQLFASGKITPKLTHKTVKKWVAECCDNHWNTLDGHLQRLAEFIRDNECQPTPELAWRLNIATFDATSDENLLMLKDWLSQLHAAHLAAKEEWRQGCRQREAERDAAREQEIERLQERDRELGPDRLSDYDEFQVLGAPTDIDEDEDEDDEE
jgi:hypothetical protein